MERLISNDFRDLTLAEALKVCGYARLQTPLARRTARTHTAHGHGCNFCYVIPEWDMVVVRLGTTPLGRSTQNDPLWNTFFDMIAEALGMKETKP